MPGKFSMPNRPLLNNATTQRCVRQSQRKTTQDQPRPRSVMMCCSAARPRNYLTVKMPLAALMMMLGSAEHAGVRRT